MGAAQIATFIPQQREPYTRFVNSRLDDYIDNTELTGLQIRLLLFVERNTTGWHKQAVFISVVDLAKRLKTSRGHLSRVIRQLTKKKLLYRHQCDDNTPSLLSLTPVEFGLLPEQDIRVCSRGFIPCASQCTGGCALTNAGEQMSVPMNTEETGSDEGINKEVKEKQTPPSIPKQESLNIKTSVVETSVPVDPLEDAFAELEATYPETSAKLNRELGLRRLGMWLSSVSLSDILNAAKVYRIKAEFFLPLDQWLGEKCLRAWLSPRKESSKPRTSRRPRKHQQVSIAQPTTPSIEPREPVIDDPEAIAWSVLARSGNDSKRAILTLAQFIIAGATTLEHATTAVTGWVMNNYTDAPEEAVVKDDMTRHLTEAIQLLEKETEDI